MDRCTRCSAGIPDPSSRYCSACGHPLATVAADSVQAARDAAASELQDWRRLRSVLLLYGLLLATLMPLWFVGGRHRLTGMLIVGLIHAGIICWAVHATGFAWRTRLQWNRTVARWVGIGVAWIAAALVVNILYQRFLHLLLADGRAAAADPLGLAGQPLAFGLLVTAVMPAVWEELAFRGIVHETLCRVVDPRQAVLIGAALFAILHCQFVEMPYLFALGCVLGQLRVKSGSLIPGMIAHGTHNGIATLIAVLW